jgi:short-subunit dehydrogenase
LRKAQTNGTNLAFYATTMRHLRALLLLSAALHLAACATLDRKDEAAIRGKTFVITGASSGFGRGVALKVASHGGNVVLAARRTELLEEVATEARRAGGDALVVTTDVSRAEDMRRLAAAAVERFGRIDAWINDAGQIAIGRFWDIPVEDHSRLVDVNLKGVIFGSHEALRQFRAQGYGTLVNLGSVESEVPLAYHGSYAATKAAILSLGRGLNEELRLHDLRRIRVSTILPWAADTPIWTHAANYSGGTPRMGLMDPPEKVVNAIVYAALHPREELSVGWKAKVSYASHQILPDVTERIAAKMAHYYQVETAPPAPPTSGSLHQPMEAGRTVDGGTRERMKRENEARRRGGQGPPE